MQTLHATTYSLKADERPNSMLCLLSVHPQQSQCIARYGSGKTTQLEGIQIPPVVICSLAVVQQQPVGSPLDQCRQDPLRPECQ